MALIQWGHDILDLLATLFVAVVGVVVLVLIIVYFIDKTQTQQTIRRNYPVLGRFRYLFEHMGEFFRQYFFAGDREELPFNRAQRSWAYRAAKDVDNTISFGSTKDLRIIGSVHFLNCAFPLLPEEFEKPSPVVIGPYLASPYKPRSYFNISGMSYGALSAPAVTALATGAKMAGCYMNTGEGGVSDLHLAGGCDLVYQIGTAKYGVRDAEGNLDLEKLKNIASKEQVRMFEIKLSQGAKPGKGGILPGKKVTVEIAKTRGIPVGQDSISPSRHKEINSTETLLDFVKLVRDTTQKPVGIKFVLGDDAWLEDLCQLIHERGIESAPDFFTVDGGDGGTGAAPMPLMDDVGLTLKHSLPLVIDTLRKHKLKDRIAVIASGKLTTPNQVAWAMALGVDLVNTARGFMFALGCVQALQCNKNTCPTGITTHDKKLQRGLVAEEKAVRVKNFHHRMVAEVDLIAHACGVACPRSLTRHHVSILVEEGKVKRLSELYPEVLN